MASLINIGMSGLSASQAGLHTTGNNIANADVAGYSRQQNVQRSKGSLQEGQVFMGTGTTLADVRRVYNAFLDAQLQTATSLNSDSTAYLNQVTPLNNLLSDSNTGITGALTNFFSALQSAANKPTEDASRQLLLSNADALANRFNSLAAQFKEQNTNINGSLSSMTARINELTSSIAQYNEQISKVSAVTGQPNDLLDQRNEAVRQLNELVGVQAVERDGSIDVYLKNGQSLVLGKTTNKMSAEPSATDPTQYSIKLDRGSTTMDVTSSITGGEMGGLLRYRSETLAPAMNELGRIALVVSQQINSQLGQGIDKNGEFGAALFNDLNSDKAMSARSTPKVGNSGSADLNVVIRDTGKLSTSDYQVTFVGPTADKYQVKKLPDGTDMGTYSTNDDPAPVIDGFSIDLKSGTAAVGDSFKITPTRNAAAEIDVVLTDAKRLALAAPLTATSGSGNTGTGVIAQPVLTSVLDIADPTQRLELQTGIKYSTPVRLVFGDETTSPQTYEAFDAKGNSIGTGTFVPGQNNTLKFDVPMIDSAGNPITDGSGVQKTFSFEMDVAGSPKQGDSYTVSLTGAGSSDNRNALSLQELQTKQTMDIGSTKGISITDAYGKLVESVGAQAKQGQMDSEATGVILTQATGARDSLSGVQLDEEAGNLVKYQQYYTASSQIIKAAQEIFNTLIAAL
ncbi:flagellar hook-associated protein FlgK [Pseudomonas sp. SWI6]|uniref:Flagellar hook-associated protein 1 n=1 Tax=Pseudomonas taiwanensis TaxID=470150 RepID=A0ABR6VA41_9PSED|nr:MULTISPECIES: flagellar hook-associated protein FlgK [Pseudomonas]AGZ36250.1 flagellar hook-associated protein FlgK [Pseudomonas sp. VLB120]AVD82269.1 flagellar hook-associated protein FlgK [Pseudomonas sp. SWI6]AVD89226.1 flagellar hook-associated protein FlgK [Pseudomonas sp. SWI44]MBC3477394.1 flagellar hook-associated protein FlgK [Pseudomonas taiwanensis]MBC3492880.1 flagellar hook-associated protein FlgK [Pseudomonas taiwanensis]